MNLTVLNGMAVTGRFSEEPKFIPSSGLGELIDIQFAHSDVLWPWSGYLALYITVKPSGADARGKVRAPFPPLAHPSPRHHTATRCCSCALTWHFPTSRQTARSSLPSRHTPPLGKTVYRPLRSPCRSQVGTPSKPSHLEASLEAFYERK